MNSQRERGKGEKGKRGEVHEMICILRSMEKSLKHFQGRLPEDLDHGWAANILRLYLTKTCERCLHLPSSIRISFEWR